MHTQVSPALSRPLYCHGLYGHERQRLMFRGRGDVVLSVHEGRLIGYGDIIVVDGADRMEAYKMPELLRSACSRAPGLRMLALGTTLTDGLRLLAESGVFTVLTPSAS